MDKKIYKPKDIPSFINKVIVLHWPNANVTYIGTVKYMLYRSYKRNLEIRHILRIDCGAIINSMMGCAMAAPIHEDGIIVRLPNEEEYKLYKTKLRTGVIYNKWR